MMRERSCRERGAPTLVSYTHLAYLERWFPDWRQCPYLSRMSRAHRLLLSLLGKKRYGLVALLFQLKGRLG